MSQLVNQKEWSKDSSLKRSIYNKVAALREDFYQNQSPNALDNLFSINSKSSYASLLNQKSNLMTARTKQANPQSIMSLVKLNDLSKVNRADLLQKQRLQFQKTSERKIASAHATFSQTSHDKPFHSTKEVSLIKQRSLSSKIDIQKTKFSFNNPKIQNSLAKQKKLTKTYFSSKLIVGTEKQSIGDHLKSKTHENESIKCRSQHKLMRVLGFLDKNNNLPQNKIHIQKKLDLNSSVVKDFQLMTDSRVDLKKQANQRAFMQKQLAKVGLQSQELELEEKDHFLPIGQAIKLRGSLNNSYQNKFQQKSLDREQNQQKQMAIKVIESKLSSYSKPSVSGKEQVLKQNYLKKGDRIRDLLFKKLLKKDANGDQPMVYVRQYDQWMPSDLVQNNKNELEVYLQLLLGQKKQIKTKKFTLNDAEIIYY